MRIPRLLISLCFTLVAARSAYAEDPPEAKPEEAKPDEAKPDEAKPDQAKPEDAKPDEAKPEPEQPKTEHGDKPAHDAKPEASDHEAKPAAEADGVSTNPVDSDGDGEVSAEEIADNKEFDADFKDIADAPDAAALASRSEDAELVPSMSAERFRKLVATARKVVLAKMTAKIEKKSEQRMRNFSIFVFVFSTLGVLLLAMPLVLKNKYPGQGKLLLKYSALAALTFFVTVNLFGVVLFGLRTAQGALSGLTNPSIAIAAGTFDALDKNAEDFLVTGKELFAPTLEQMRAHPDDTPVVGLLENAGALMKDVKVFLKIKSMFKSVDFIFAVLPIILMIVTMVLFILAIRPTLTEIVKLPATAAQTGGSVGKEVVANSMKRVKGELLATLCTVGVLAVLTLVSAFILGRTVQPALETFLGYFSAAVNYLQFVSDASTMNVYASLVGVILFLVLNLAVLILSMSFFLGKCQKIFQQRFNEGTPVSTHARFFKWGIPSVLFVQLFPLLYMYVADVMLEKINDSILDGVQDAEQVPWTKLMVMGPLVLVLGFLVLFWAVRGFKAIGFLFKYQVKPKPLRPVV